MTSFSLVMTEWTQSRRPTSSNLFIDFLVFSNIATCTNSTLHFRITLVVSHSRTYNGEIFSFDQGKALLCLNCSCSLL